MNEPTFIPYRIDVLELNGLTFIFAPIGLDIQVTDRPAFETAYAEASGYGKSWTNRDVLADWFEPLRANGVAEYFYDIADENPQLGWLTSADAIYHNGLEVAYLNEAYAVRDILDNLVRPENWEEALFPDRFNRFYMPGYELDSRWLSGDLRDAAEAQLLGKISELEYHLVLAETFGEDYTSLFAEDDDEE